MPSSSKRSSASSSPTNNLLAAQRGRKWAKFAELYNGKAYAENLYDVKLERAFDRYSRAAA